MQWSLNLCRLCGKDSHACQAISADLEDKIRRCLNIKIETHNEYKPQNMCLKCISKLLKFSNFIDISHRNDLKFQSLYHNCKEISKRERSVDSCLLVSRKGKNFSGSLGKDKFSKSNCEVERRKRHLITHPQKKPMKCTKCPQQQNICKCKKLKKVSNLLCHSKKNLAKKLSKSRSKRSDKFYKKHYKDRIPTKKCKYERYLALCRKYLKISPILKKRGHRSQKVSRN